MTQVRIHLIANFKCYIILVFVFLISLLFIHSTSFINSLIIVFKCMIFEIAIIILYYIFLYYFIRYVIRFQIREALEELQAQSQRVLRQSQQLAVIQITIIQLIIYLEFGT